MLEYDPTGEADDSPYHPPNLLMKASQRHDLDDDRTQRPTVGHIGLSNCLSAWSHLMGMSQLDHVRQSQEYLGREPSDIPEESDYIENLLQDETLVKHFTAHAKRHDWVEWFCRTDAFKEMLDNSHDCERLNALRRWYGELCATSDTDDQSLSGTSRAAVVNLVAERVPPNSVMRMSVLRALGSSAGELTDVEVSWLLWVLQDNLPFNFQSAPMVNQVMLMRILARCDIGSQAHVGLEILHHMLRLDMQLVQPHLPDRLPELSLPEGLSMLTQEHDDAPRINATVQSWIDAKPANVIEIAATHIARIVRLKGASDSTGSSHNSISFNRSAIEPHPQDMHHGMHRSLVDDVIDIARDALVRLCEVDPGRAGTWIDGALESDAALIRRIAIHGLGQHNSRSADERLQKVMDLDLFDDIYLHHEIFQLIANLTPQASAGMLDRLVEHIAGSLEQHDGEYERHDDEDGKRT